MNGLCFTSGGNCQRAGSTGLSREAPALALPLACSPRGQLSSTRAPGGERLQDHKDQRNHSPGPAPTSEEKVGVGAGGVCGAEGGCLTVNELSVALDEFRPSIIKSQKSFKPADSLQAK